MAEVSPADLRIKGRDILFALSVTVAVVIGVSFGVSSLTEPPTTTAPRPVARVTSADLRAMADLLRTVEATHNLSPAEERTVDRLGDVVEAVENGEVQIVPDTTAPPTTTSTTTTQAPPTTAAPPASWPGEFDAQDFLPTTTTEG